MKNFWHVIGIMSGTSLDGLDIAFCRFDRDQEYNWRHDFIATECFGYDSTWKQRLNDAHSLNGLDLMALHKEYGTYIGAHLQTFMRGHNAQPELIASHGHTVFHRPDKKLSFQLGDGAAIYAATDIPVVCDFRSVDVCRGGQGAPMVPVGDALLFKQYSHCLNLGGIANISYDNNGARIAYDISGCNLLLNAVANEIGLDYDDNGQLAKSGKINGNLLQALDEERYYQLPPPKSLDKETMLSAFLPLVRSFTISPEDKLATIVEHISSLVSKAIGQAEGSLLVTGGGALNGFLVEKIREKVLGSVIVPSLELIQFKEALIFAFLGLLRALQENNTLASVTGATKDGIGGAIYGGFCGLHPEKA